MDVSESLVNYSRKIILIKRFSLYRIILYQSKKGHLEMRVDELEANLDSEKKMRLELERLKRNLECDMKLSQVRYS